MLLPGFAAAAETRHAAIVVDANTGKVLYEQLADAQRHPASLTKIMTLYLVFEAIEQGRLSYTSKITVSEKATSVAPSKLDLDAGEEIALIDAIKSLITKSANDMAVAVAEAIGGTEVGFVRMMNERARQIGMRSTLFTNASGLPDPRQVTTARDMVTLGLRLQDDFPRHYPLFALKSFEFRGKTYRTHNTLLYGFPGMDGIKTGYTKASGFNLVSSVRAHGKHLVAAVFGGATASARNAHMRMQLFRALEKASPERTRRAGPMLIAKATQAKKPEPAPVVSKPAIESAAAAIKPQPVREIREAPAVAQAPSPASQAEPDRLAAAGPEIAVVKVRPVSITGPSDAQASPGSAQPAAAPAAAASSVTPKLDLQALRAAISSDAAAGAAAGVASPAAPAPASIEDIISSTTPQAPEPFRQQVAMADTMTDAGRSPNAFASSANNAVRAPSTLDAQAAAMSPPAPARPVVAPLKPAALDAPARFAAAPVGRGYEIQIGAYSSAAEAENRMSAARTRAAGLLEGHKSVALAVQKADKKIFRARFTGFDEDTAGNACLELRRLAIDCFVMKAE